MHITKRQEYTMHDLWLERTLLVGCCPAVTSACCSLSTLMLRLGIKKVP